jgi:hypothetical protein
MGWSRRPKGPALIIESRNFLGGDAMPEPVIRLPATTRLGRRVLGDCRWKLRTFVERDAHVEYDFGGGYSLPSSDRISEHQVYGMHCHAGLIYGYLLAFLGDLGTLILEWLSASGQSGQERSRSGHPGMIIGKRWIEAVRAQENGSGTSFYESGPLARTSL